MDKGINTILMMGKTGSGKGTQSDMIAGKLGWKIFSTGGRFRQIKKGGDFLGERVREEYDQGILMPHWFASFLFEEELLKLTPEMGLVCEGIGRKEPEARLFHDVATWLHRDYVVFEFTVTDEEATKRMLGRDRGDSLNDEEKIKVRLKEYRNFTESAINFFKEKGKVIEIDGMKTPEEIHENILEKIKGLNIGVNV
ncbi:MAG: nucleoside monophosphate kinase [bacterium]|nr:nucleoside monophosphate kinase [bacterium]